MLLGLWGASKQSWSHWRWKRGFQLGVSIWCYSDSSAEVQTALNCNLPLLVLKTDLPMELPLRSTNLNQLAFGPRPPANLTVSYRMQLSACIAHAYMQHIGFSGTSWVFEAGRKQGIVVRSGCLKTPP